MLNTPQSRDSIKQYLTRQKTVDRLVAIAKDLDKTKETTDKEAAK